MPTQTPSPQGSQPPVPPLPPGATVITSGSDGKTITIQGPQTDAQVFALVSRRDQLSSQIEDAMDRRQEIVEQIQSAPDGVARTGLEQQAALLDGRILAMERELATTESQITQAPADLIALAERDSRPDPAPVGDRVETVATIGAFILAAMVLQKVLSRMMSRPRHPAAQPALPALPSEASERLERLERGMESIAIEIERISEGQRFVTKLMAENAPSKQLDRVE